MEPLFLQIFLLVNVFVIGILVTLAIQHARDHYSSHPTPGADANVLPANLKASITNEAQQQYKTMMDNSVASLQQDLASTNHRLNEMLEKLVTYAVNAEMERYRESLDVLHQQNESVLRDSLRNTTQQHVDLKTKLIKRQAELDQSLVEHQTKLERQLAEHHSRTEAQLNDRQMELDKELSERQAKNASEQAAIEAQLTKHQAEVEEKLRDHQQKLIDALNEREARLAEIQATLESDLLERQTHHAEAQEKLEEQLAKDIADKKAFLQQQIDTKLADAVTSFLVESLGQNVDLGAQASYLTTLLEEHKKELIEGVKNV